MVITIPIIYGSHAFPITSDKDRPDPSHTHKWKVYVKSGNGCDISWLFDKIQFTLHESFHNHRRQIPQPPYEVFESGWGEFDIMIKFYFKDGEDKPIAVMHHLKLFHSPADSPSKDTDVISERYDELIINDPSESLMKAFQVNQGNVDQTFSTQFTKSFEQKELSTLLQALNKVTDEISLVKGQIEAMKGASSSSTPALGSTTSLS